MNPRTTHTFSVLEISKAAYDEIRAKLIQAGYDHVIMKESDREVIDMHGIAVQVLDESLVEKEQK